MTTSFRVVYFAVIVLIVAMVIVAVVMGLSDRENPVGTATMLAYLSLIFVGLPLFIVFLGLNVWGFVRHNTHRLRYGLVIVPVALWIVWSIFEYLTLPLP